MLADKNEPTKDPDESSDINASFSDESVKKQNSFDIDDLSENNDSLPLNDKSKNQLKQNSS